MTVHAFSVSAINLNLSIALQVVWPKVAFFPSPTKILDLCRLSSHWKPFYNILQITETLLTERFNSFSPSLHPLYRVLQNLCWECKPYKALSKQFLSRFGAWIHVARLHCHKVCKKIDLIYQTVSPYERVGPGAETNGNMQQQMSSWDMRGHHEV